MQAEPSVQTTTKKETCETLLQKEYARLNDRQKAAVNHKAGPAAVAGCPGAGKTRVLITRLLKLFVDGVRPERICATTFSKAAAAEIEKRLKAMKAPSTLRVGTLHSVSYEILRDSGKYGGYYNVDGKGQMHFALKDILSRELKADKELDVKEVEEWISLAKVNILPVEEGYGAAVSSPVQDELQRFAQAWFGNGYQAMLAIRAYRLFEEQRTERCLLTFSDMLLGAVLALRDPAFQKRWSSKYDHVMLDEAHDSNIAQIELAERLSNNCQNLMVFHSVSQSIYAWRGAKPSYLLDFTKDFDLYPLPLSYRCGKRIADAASDLVEDADWNIEGRIIPLREDEPAEDSLRFISVESAKQEASEIAGEIEKLHREHAIPFSAFCILYRTTSLLLEPELALLRRNIPYRVLAGSNFFQRREVAGLINYLAVAAVRDPSESAAHAITNTPFRYISKKVIESAKTIAVTKNIAYLDALTKTSLRANQRSRVDGLMRTIKTCNGKIVRGAPSKDVLEYILKSTNYISWLEKSEGTGGPNSEAPKAAYVHEFVRFSEQYDTVPQLLDAIDELSKSLRSARRSRKKDYVTLSTLHSSKGLEFDRVYIIGCADGLLPHYLNPEKDEERRLLYVGVTRARDYCTLSWPRRIATPRGIINTTVSPLLKKLRGP